MIADLPARNAEIRALMRDRLRVSGRSLSRQIDRAGRRLPRAVARDARLLAQAEGLAANPKLARMLDPARLDAAHANVVAHLVGIDPRAARIDRLLGLSATIGFNLLLVGAGVVTLLWWQGLV